MEEQGEPAVVKPVRPRVVGFGAMNVDELYRVRSVLADDESPIEARYSAAGGSAANTIYGLAKLGIATGFIGVIGGDEAGKFLLDDFRAVGVDVSGVAVKHGAATGKVLALSDAYGKRALYVMAGANSLLCQADVDLDYAKQTEVLHISSFVDDRQFELQKRLVNSLPSSIKVSFSPGAIYARKGLASVMPVIRKSYIVFLNKREAEELTGANFKTAANFFLSEGCKIVVVTMGRGERGPRDAVGWQLRFEFERVFSSLAGSRADLPLFPQRGKEEGQFQLKLLDAPIPPAQEDWRFSAYVATPEKEHYEEAPNHEKGGKDTTGAGDAFACGFLYGLLSKKTIDECARLGVLLSGFCISEIGARTGLPTLSTLEESLKARQSSFQKAQ